MPTRHRKMTELYNLYNYHSNSKYVCPKKITRELFSHLRRYGHDIEICGNYYKAVDFKLSEMLKIWKYAKYSKNTTGCAMYRKADYDEYGDNPFNYEYINGVPDNQYLVHYDNDEGQSYSPSIIWSACDPINDHCGTHVCKQRIPTKHNASNPLPMKIDDVDAFPSETLIFVNLFNTAHAPPNFIDTSSLSERIFFTFDVPFEMIKNL